MNSEILMYQTDDGSTKIEVRIEVRIEDETVWLRQAQMAELFQTSTQNITMHIKNVYDEVVVEAESTCKEPLQVRQEGDRTVKGRLKPIIWT